MLRTSDENIVDLLIKSSVLEPLVRGLKEAQTDDEAAGEFKAIKLSCSIAITSEKL